MCIHHCHCSRLDTIDKVQCKHCLCILHRCSLFLCHKQLQRFRHQLLPTATNFFSCQQWMEPNTSCLLDPECLGNLSCIHHRYEELCHMDFDSILYTV